MIQSPYKLYLTCPKGFESICSQELKSIGIQHRKIKPGGVSFSGNMDTCIALRTLVIKEGVAHVQAGGGIVADSDIDSEYEETINKASAVMKAISIAEAQSS